jgi:monofunctional biosynthetic peptidoglycan transglycosylase
MVMKWIRNGAIILVAAFCLHLAFYLVYPDISRLKKEWPAKTAFMEYRERQWGKAGLKKRVKQEWVPLAAISPYVVKAVIIAEDDKFWSHEGFDFEAIQKALEKDLKKRGLKAGGSTISQQLAKNLFLTPARNPVRKLKEAILTWRLERNLTKRRIIEIYLNVVEWGDGIFGIEAAARHYFGKSAASLSAYEAVSLAAVLPSPLRYNPVAKGPYVESRAEALYRIMVGRGIVIPEYDLLDEPSATGEPQTPGAGSPADRAPDLPDRADSGPEESGR